MNMKLKLSLIILLSLVLIALIFITIHNVKANNNTIATMKAVVVKVSENSLLVMDIENSNNLISLGTKNITDIRFKQGQEILIYFDGIVLSSYPGQLGHVGKVKLLKEKTDITIPEDILRYAYNSKDNVNVNVSELTGIGLSLFILDTNKLPYNYSKDYTLTKKIKNKDYTEIGYKIGEDTENSTSGYSGIGTEYIWKELEKTSDVSKESTMKISTNKTASEVTSTNIKFNWLDLYGELNERRI